MYRMSSVLPELGLLVPFGLFLDLVGAGILAAAEIQHFRKWLEPDELAEGRDRLWRQPHKLEQGDEGFEEIYSLLKKETDTVEDIENVDQFSKSSLARGTEKIFVGRLTEGSVVTSAHVLDVWVEREIDRRIGRTYRLWGAGLLVAGFLLQIVGYYFS